MTPTQQHSTKFDGRLHYRYAVRPIVHREDLLITYSAPGSPMESCRERRTTTMHMLAVFHLGRHYNLHVAWHEDWRPMMHYVDIATPATWHDGAVRYVDLDLDVIRGADTGEVKLDDADEFETHRVEWGYPPELVECCWRAADEVKSLFRDGIWPFDDSLYAWRPGQAVPLPA
jgi:protein associated with RNAse G/E